MSKSKPPRIDPARPLAAQAVMNVEKGEEIAGMWITPHVPQIGIYKSLNNPLSAIMVSHQSRLMTDN